jgi:hypothetical protein
VYEAYSKHFGDAVPAISVGYARVTFRQETEPEGAVVQKLLCQHKLFGVGKPRGPYGKSRAGTLLIRDFSLHGESASGKTGRDGSIPWVALGIVLIIIMAVM